MGRLRDLAEVDVDYATSGPNHATIRQHIDAPAAALFRSFEDASAWKEWLGWDVEWTSPKPFGVGTTRTLTKGRKRIDEVFLAWDDGRRINFRFTRTTLPLGAFAEDYVVEPRGESACELAWTYAWEWGGPLKPLGNAVFGFFFGINGRRVLRKLARLMASSGDRFSS